MASPQEFARQYGPLAAQVGQNLGVAPEILLGQWGLETGWGRSVIPGTNNLGNIKDFSGSGVAATDNMTGSRDKYRAYDTADAFGQDFAGLIGRRYKGAMGVGNDAQKWAEALKAGGYAEDPDYVRKVVAATDLVRKSGGIGDRIAAALLPSAQAAEVPQAGFSSKIEQARKAGYSDAEIMQHLSQSAGFSEKLRKAREAGYTDAEIFQHLGLSAPQAVPNTSTSVGLDGVMRVEMAHENPTAGPEERSMIERLGRQVGLTARAGLGGIAALPEMIVNPLARMAGLPDMRIGDTLDALGFAKPENATERVAQDVVGGMAGVGGTARLAQQALTPLVNTARQGVASLIGGNVGAQVGSATAGTGAAGIARENDVGPAGQLVAGLIGGMAAPAAQYGAGTAIRRIVRGGEEGRQQVASNIENFRKAGTTPTVGQATERPLMQGLETVMAQSPGGAGIMARKSAAQTEEIARRVDGIVNRLAPQAGTVEAGEAVTRGLEGFKVGIKRVQSHLYDRLDDFLPDDARVNVTRTRDALAALNSDIEGAPALSQMFKNSRIRGIEGALSSDLKSGTSAYGAQAVRRTTTLPYESIKKLRTLVGKEIDNANFTSDVPRDKWRALYRALSEDLGDAARQAGPEAYDAWRWANQFTRDQVGRLDELSSIAGRDTPEKIFNAAMAGSADGDTVLRRVISAIPKENRRELAAAVIRRMGRATASNQNDASDAFSTTTFLTNWNKLSPQARQTLFGRVNDPKLLSDLDNLAKVATNIRDGSRYLANPSGSAPAAARQAMLGAGALAAVTGNIPVLAGMGGGMLLTNALSRALTNPNRLMQLAGVTPVPVSSAIGGLQGMIPRE